LLTEFLQTGNGTVIVNGLQPQPISGIKNVLLAAQTSLMQLILPRDANGQILPGAYCGEYMIQAFDVLTGDVFNRLVRVAITRFAGSTVIAVPQVIGTTAIGALAGMIESPVVLPSGDVDFTVTTGVAASVNVSGLGVFLTV